MHRRLSIALLAAIVSVLAACGTSDGSSPTITARPTVAATQRPSPATPSPPPATPEPVATLIAAGDIASCDEEGDSATAALVAGLEGTIAVLGDTVYPAGSDETYAACYDPVWGAWRDRTRPAIGNHDVAEDGGAAYFRYFGDAAGTPGEGWYSYDLGAWHVVVLNSNCVMVGCGHGSAQVDWLTNDLAASDASCTLAYMHSPRFTSGPHGDDPALDAFWDVLIAAGADVILGGHDHHYERFAPQAADRGADPNGLRQFVAGTGGKKLRPAVRVAANSEVIIDDAFGVLVLVLRPDRYEWQFVETDGTEGDIGADACH